MDIADILSEHIVPPMCVDPSRDILYYYDLLAVLDDEFLEAKKRCYSTDVADLEVNLKSLLKPERVAYHVAKPFTLKDRDGSSFRDERLRNLIIDHSDTLLKLVFETTETGSIPPGCSRIKTIEYELPNRVLAARKFISYK